MASATLACAAIGAAGVACYGANLGQAPPIKSFYYPVGLAVSPNGNVLYAVNSDFDLQWNGGTLQSYDLFAIRRDAGKIIQDATNPTVPLAPGVARPQNNDCPSLPEGGTRYDDSGQAQPLGWTCAPPVDSTFYERDSVVIGAFATDLRLVHQLQLDPTTKCTKSSDCQAGWTCAAHQCRTPVKSRLFMPVRGDASLTWADVAVDPDTPPPDPTDPAVGSYPGFYLDCGTRTADGRCDAPHHAGSDPNEPGNTRGFTMPGEPYGIGVSEDRTNVVVTHQNDTKVSLFLTGLAAPSVSPAAAPPGVATPSLQFVLDGLPGGGVAITPVAHDDDAYPSCVGQPGPCLAAPRPAFLEVSRVSTLVSLLRYYDDQAPGLDDGGADSAASSSSLLRPFLIDEAAFPLTPNTGGTDSRGVLIDPTPRVRCKAGVDANPPGNQADYQAAILACARLPARVFITNRTPASLVIGTIGDSPGVGDSTYSPDSFRASQNAPLPTGPSRLYLAPIVDGGGNYALRVFVVCYDASEVFVYDPDANAIEGFVKVPPGPFAMTFDPFPLEDAALGRPVPFDPRQDPSLGLRRYRFAYVASFTNSDVQLIDLDATQPNTFETVVFRLGLDNPPVQQ